MSIWSLGWLLNFAQTLDRKPDNVDNINWLNRKFENKQISGPSMDTLTDFWTGQNTVWMIHKLITSRMYSLKTEIFFFFLISGYCPPLLMQRRDISRSVVKKLVGFTIRTLLSATLLKHTEIWTLITGQTPPASQCIHARGDNYVILFTVGVVAIL